MGQMDIGDIITLIALTVSLTITLATIAAAWGSLKSQVGGIHYRLDRLNGRTDAHSHRLDDHGERIAHIEGHRGSEHGGA